VDSFFGEIIHAYSRTQAVADGVLIDVTATAKEAGFVWPVAFTAAAWADCVAWSDADTRRTGALQDETGRLWDVLWMARMAAQRAGHTDRMTFEVLRVPTDGDGNAATLVQLVLHIGPGDTPAPVITIMQPGED
jgi:hypothetical protein